MNTSITILCALVAYLLIGCVIGTVAITKLSLNDRDDFLAIVPSAIVFWPITGLMLLCYLLVKWTRKMTEKNK